MHFKGITYNRGQIAPSFLFLGGILFDTSRNTSSNPSLFFERVLNVFRDRGPMTERKWDFVGLGDQQSRSSGTRRRSVSRSSMDSSGGEGRHRPPMGGQITGTATKRKLVYAPLFVPIILPIYKCLPFKLNFRHSFYNCAMNYCRNFRR